MTFQFTAMGYSADHGMSMWAEVLDEEPSQLRFRGGGDSDATTYVHAYDKDMSEGDVLSVGTEPLHRFEASVSGGTITTSEEGRIVHDGVRVEVKVSRGPWDNGEQTKSCRSFTHIDGAKSFIYKRYADFLDAIKNGS